MPDLVPIKVILKRDDAGVQRTDQNGKKTVWPNMRDTDPVTRDNMLPHEFVDKHGGWCTDKVNNLGTGAVNGAACALVPKAFADECIRLGFATKQTEAEFDTFYDTRHIVRVAPNKVHGEHLQGLRQARQLMKDLTDDPATADDYTTDIAALNTDIRKALDPDDPSPGLVRHKDLTASDLKTRRGIKVVQ